MKNHLRTVWLAIFFLGAGCVSLAAQTNSSGEIKPETKAAPVETAAESEMRNRVSDLEAQIKTLQAQIDALKNLIVQSAKTQTAAPQTETTVAKTAEIKPAETAKTETKQTTQPKKDLGVDVGTARVIPYGTIFFNAFANSGGTNNADVPLFAAPAGGGGNASASVRQTRLGLKLEGARVGKARLGAVIEADFFGGFPSVGIGENFGVVRLRLANARLDWEKTSVTAGQDWMVFAPVNPASLAAAAIPQMAAAGNNWARIPQIKVEQKLNKNFTWAGAVLAPQTGDAPANAAFFLQPTSGASSRVPFLQTRLAFAEMNWFNSKKAGSIGLSAHYGRSRVFTGAGGSVKNDIDSAALALDWNFPLHERVTFAGEAFFGRDLGGFQSGIFQGYNNDFAFRSGANLIAGGVRAIGTRGGWTQLGFTPGIWKNRLSLYGSIGLDDPRDEDLVSLSRRDFRSRNLAFAFDAIYKFTPQFQIGAEFRRFQTDYVFSGRRRADHVNLAAAYSF